MRKITIFFVSFLIALFGLWVGDAIDKSEDIIKSDIDVASQTFKAAKSAEQYISIGEAVMAGGALITGIISFATRRNS